MINRENYEIWFIDYLDGKLELEQVAELLLFLESNLDLAEELDGLDDVVLKDDAPVFSGKESLLKDEAPLSEEDINLLLAKKLEGDLKGDEITFVDALIQENEWAAQSWKVMQATKLEADAAEFGNKNEVIIPASVDLTNPNMRAIAVAEGDLEASRISADEQKLAATYAALKVKPDYALQFANKASLKQGAAVVSLWPTVARIAAVAAAVLLIWQIGFADRTTIGSGIEDFAGSVEVKAVSQPTQAPEQNDEEAETTPFERSTPKEYIQPMPNSVPQNQPVFASLDSRKPAPAILNSLNATRAVSFANLPGQDIAYYTTPLEFEIPEAAEMTRVDDSDDYASMTDFLGNWVKGGLWGGDDYPQENFTLALASKATQKYSRRSGAKVNLDSEEDSKFRLRLGKLEVSRK